MKKREIFTYVMVIFSVFLTASIVSYFILIQKLLSYKSLILLDQIDSLPKKNLTRVCPDKWVNNQMPGETEIPRQYFVVDGKRRELAEFDLNWIKQHCKVKPEFVY